MSLNTILADMKSRLADVPNIKTIGIGIEANLSPTAYPAIRIVPDNLKRINSVTRTAEVRVYAGLPLVEGATSIEAITTQLLTMEEQIVNLVQEGTDYRSIHQRTLMSSSEVESYRLICVVLEVGWML